MSRQEPPFRQPIIIGLISDDEDVVQPSPVVDLTSLVESGSSSNLSLEASKPVEDQTPSLTSGYSQKEGSLLSPKTQPQSDDNPTDSELTLGNTLALARKRKHASNKTAIPKPESDSSSLALTKKAVSTFLGPRLSKPNTKFWTIHKPASPGPAPSRTQPSDGHSKKKDKPHYNPLILNIDRDETFGREIETRHSDKYHGRKKGSSRKLVTNKDVSEPLPRTRNFSNTNTTPAKVSKTSIEGEVQQSQIGIAGSDSHARRRDTNSQAKPQSSAFDDVAPSSNPKARRRRSQDVLPADQPDAIQDRPRTVSSAPRASSVGRGRRSRERSHSFSSTSRQRRSSRPRDYSLVGDEQPRQSSIAENRENERERRKRLRNNSILKGANRSSRQPRKVAKQQRRQKEAPVPSRRAISQQPDSLFDSDTSSQDVTKTNDAPKRTFGIQSRTQLRPRELTDVGGSTTHQSNGGHGRQQQQQKALQEPLPQQKPSAISLSTSIVRHESSQTLVSRNETFEDAAAAFNLLASQHAKKRTATILDSVPADLGMPSRASRVRATSNAIHFGRKAHNPTRDARNKRERYRANAIANKRRKLEQDYAREPSPYREALINEELDACRRRFAENDRKRRAEGEHDFLTVDFLEDGAVADDEDANDASLNGGGARQAPVPEGLIPASQAMEPGETIVVYAVYISEPFMEGEEFEDHMQRIAEAFLKKEEANAFALKLLTETVSSSRQPVREYPTVYYKTDGLGLLQGRKWLPNGKFVYCMVRKEKQLFGRVDMSRKWVRKEVKDLYRPRYDVFYTHVIPKVFLDKEEDDKVKKKEEQAREAAAQAEKEKDPEETGVQGEENEREESPEQWVWKGLDDDEGDDSSRLFSATPIREIETSQETNDESPSQEGNRNDRDDEDDNDTASVASDGTLQASHPGGALGNLSWGDVEFQTIHAASYTDLRLANEAALRVARLIWKPRNPRLYAWEHYQYAIIASLEEGREDWDLDADRAEFEFDVPEFEGLVDHRPWLFVHSRVYVVESKLEGPRDVGCDFVVVNDEDE